MEQVKEVLHTRDVNLKSTEKNNVLEECHLIAVRSQISSLKCAAVESHVALWFCNKLGDVHKENCLTDSEDQEREKMKQSKESANGKTNIAEVEENLKNLSETVQTCFTSNQEKTSLLENQLSLDKEKGERCKTLLERRQLLNKEKELYFNNAGKTVSSDNLQEKVQQNEEERKECVAGIESLTEQKLLMDAELRSLRELRESSQEKLYSMKKVEEKSLKQNREKERMVAWTNLLTALSGFRVLNMEENCITIELQDIQQEESSEEKSVILLTIRFAEVAGSYVVKNVKTDSLTFFIKDIIEQVKLTSHVKVFLLEVQKRFHNEAKLLKEMKRLQERFPSTLPDSCLAIFTKIPLIRWLITEFGLDRDKSDTSTISFTKLPEGNTNDVWIHMNNWKIILCSGGFAIDWNEETRTVRVMLGKSGQIVCTLKVQNEYPTSGHIVVEEIHGADRNLLFDDMTNELKSLTSWIEYLFIKYGAL